LRCHRSVCCSKFGHQFVEFLFRLFDERCDELLRLTDRFGHSLDEDSAVALALALLLDFNVGARDFTNGVDVAAGASNHTTDCVGRHRYFFRSL